MCLEISEKYSKVFFLKLNKHNKNEKWLEIFELSTHVTILNIAFLHLIYADVYLDVKICSDLFELIFNFYSMSHFKSIVAR